MKTESFENSSAGSFKFSDFSVKVDKDEIKRQKSNLRKLMRGKIKEWVSSNNLAKNSALSCEKIISLEEYKKSDVLLAYIPMKNEADCLFAIEAALKSGKIVAVPKCGFESCGAESEKSSCAGQRAGTLADVETSTKSGTMDFYILKKDLPVESQLEKGAFGIFEPVSSLEKFSLDFESKKSLLALKIFMIVPCLAFSSDGKRLGKGKGFYDRYFERLEKAGLDVFRCGFCLPCQIADDIPCDEFDRKVDCVIY